MATASSTANDELSTLREHLARYRDVTLASLDLVPDAKLDWRPTEELRSFAEQLLHIVQVEEFYLRGLIDGDWDFDRLKKPAESYTRKYLRRRLEEGRQLVQQKLADLDAARLDAAVTVPNVPVPWPLRGWLWYLVEHEVHHKAQLSLYLRKTGITPPFFAMAFPGNLRPDIR